MMVSDGELPQGIGEDPDAYAGCIASVLDEEVYLEKIGGPASGTSRYVKKTIHGHRQQHRG